MTDGQFTNIQMIGPKAGSAPEQVVLLLHGYGSNGADLLGLAPYWADALPNAAFIGPDAPFVCEMSAMGYQWFSLREIMAGAPLADGLRRAGADEVAPALNALIDDILERFNLPSNRLALVGFSQGTMMALHVALRRAEPVAGVLGFSGMLIDPPSLAAEMTAKPPVLLVHGDADPVVPYASLARAESALREVGVAVDTLTCPRMGHSIDDAGLEAGTRFLQHCLSSAG